MHAPPCPTYNLPALTLPWLLQVTGLGVIIISAIVGLCLLLSFLRTYQQTAKMPTTKCSKWLEFHVRARKGWPIIAEGS